MDGLFGKQYKQLYNFMTKQVLRDGAQNNILEMEARAKEQNNLWDIVTKVKYLN